MEKYLKDNLSYLSTINLESLNNNMLYQLATLDANHYNITQNEIYYQLNRLYEKMRLLEDVNEYLKIKVQDKITESSAICESLLKEIEESRDAITEITYHNLYVDMQPTGSTTDRDGVQIPAAVIYNGEVVTKYNVKRNIPYVAKTKTYKKVYKNNIESLQKGEPYRSYYITDQSYKDGITERIYFTFSQATPINKIQAKTSGAKASNFQLHNAKDTINIKDLNWKDCIQSDSASFDITTTTYKEKSYLCDMSRLSPNALTTLENEIYKEIAGEKTMSQSELETLLGLKSLKSDYDRYLAQVADWNKRREQVANTNKNNGHVDNVPSHIIEKLPTELGVNEKTLNGVANTTIDTTAILPSKEIIEKDGNNERIVYMYEKVDDIYPSYERYRYDFNDPNNNRYYKYLNESQGVYKNV